MLVFCILFKAMKASLCMSKTECIKFSPLSLLFHAFIFNHFKFETISWNLLGFRTFFRIFNLISFLRLSCNFWFLNLSWLSYNRHLLWNSVSLGHNFSDYSRKLVIIFFDSVIFTLFIFLLSIIFHICLKFNNITFVLLLAIIVRLLTLLNVMFLTYLRNLINGVVVWIRGLLLTLLIFLIAFVILRTLLLTDYLSITKFLFFVIILHFLAQIMYIIILMVYFLLIW